MYECVFYGNDGAAMYRETYDSVEMAILYAPDYCAGILIHDRETGKFVAQV